MLHYKFISVHNAIEKWRGNCQKRKQMAGEKIMESG